jgi:hypothetical protein
MHTQQDFLRLEAENRLLREKLNSAADLGDEMKLGLAALLAPTTREHPELRIALLRVLASSAGLPSLCDRRECRRKGACLAEDNPPPCREHWSKRLSARFDDIAIGIEVSAICQQMVEANFYAYACEQLGLTPDGQLPSKKPRRKSAAA